MRCAPRSPRRSRGPKTLTMSCANCSTPSLRRSRRTECRRSVGRDKTASGGRRPTKDRIDEDPSIGKMTPRPSGGQAQAACRARPRGELGGRWAFPRRAWQSASYWPGIFTISTPRFGGNWLEHLSKGSQRRRVKDRRVFLLRHLFVMPAEADGRIPFENLRYSLWD
jgi:hypothetical protein